MGVLRQIMAATEIRRIVIIHYCVPDELLAFGNF